MLRWFFHRKLDAEEKKLGESMDYLRHIVDAYPSAFLRFGSIMPFANSRKVLPSEIWFAAQLTTLRHEDCGPCLQITINLALKSGVDDALIQAVIDEDVAKLSSEIIDVCNFTKSVLNGNDDPALRETLRTRYGERGLIELALAIASGRIPPTVKRVLGYASSCKKVAVHV